MDKLNASAIPTITMSEVEKVLKAPGCPDNRTHELVFPSCVIENTVYKHKPFDVEMLLTDIDKLLSLDISFEYFPIKELAGCRTLYDYDVRYDPDATELALLPKRGTPDG